MPQRSTTDLKEISDAKSRAGQETLKVAQCFREVAGTPSGRKFLFDLLAKCELEVIPAMDPLWMAFHNGKRSIGNDIKYYFNHYAPAMWGVMMKENIETPKVEENGRDDDE